MAQALLTVRKQRWVEQRKPEAIYGLPLNPNASAEIRYYDRLAKLIDRMTAGVEKQLTAFFDEPHAEEYFAQDASVGSQARILTNALSKKFNDLFAASAKPMAEQVANEANKSSSSATHSSIQQLSGGLSLSTGSITSGPLNDILTASVAENVGLIKSISQKYLTNVQGAVMRSITTGNGLQDLVPFLKKQKGITLRRARFIATDQTRKAFNALSEGRMLAVGIQKGAWLHTGGSNHPRKTHIEMSGKVFNLEKGLYDSAVKRFVKPGQEPGCRCRFKPALTLDEVEE